ncbi:hypothetical protein BDW74DRAFT_180515 [Aspergillus multicolor]|uniref:uncharacterized protein n=1 Tax=Aspergillus multicolor TaxID=41759 RepID=UPI003CCC9379
MHYLTLLSATIALLGLTSAAPTTGTTRGLEVDLKREAELLARDDDKRGLEIDLKRDAELLARDGAADGLNVGAGSLANVSGDNLGGVGKLVNGVVDTLPVDVEVDAPVLP